MPAEHDLRKLYRSIIEAVGANDADALDSLVAENIVDHNPVPGQQPGLAGIKAWMHSMHASFPDLSGVIEDTVVEGGKIAGRVTWTGTQEGTFAGVPGTGRTAAIPALHILRFEDGLAAEWWGAADLLGALTRLGARLEPPEA